MRTINEIQNARNLIIHEVGEDGGWGEVRFAKWTGSVIWSTGGGWDHVSVAPYKRSHTPTWEEMCRLKDMFFGEDEAVMQIHPPKSDYVNNMPNCLHLWKPQTEPMPMPPSIMVGIKKGMRLEEIAQAILEVAHESD